MKLSVRLDARATRAMVGAPYGSTALRVGLADGDARAGPKSPATGHKSDLAVESAV